MTNEPTNNKEKDDAKNQQECKEVALRMFEDACVLYHGGRYQGALYLSGYVIENGIKSALCRLGTQEQTKEQLLDYIVSIIYTYIEEKMSLKDNGIRSNMGTFLETFVERFISAKKTNLLDSLFSFDFTLPEDKISKHNLAIHSMAKKTAPPTKDYKYHDLKVFLEQLEYWRERLAADESRIIPERYMIDGWKSSLRYSITRSNYSAEEVRTIQKDRAKKALKNSYFFLKEVVCHCNDSNFLQNEIAKRVVVEEGFLPEDTIHSSNTTDIIIAPTNNIPEE